MSIVAFLLFAIVILALGCISDNKAVAYPSRLLVLFALLALVSGCATVDKSVGRVGEDAGAVVGSVPQWAGQVAGAAIFGGTVTANPAPDVYMKDSVNRGVRDVYSAGQLGVQKAVEDTIRRMFEPK